MQDRAPDVRKFVRRAQNACPCASDECLRRPDVVAVAVRDGDRRQVADTGSGPRDRLLDEREILRIARVDQRDLATSPSAPPSSKPAPRRIGRRAPPRSSIGSRSPPVQSGRSTSPTPVGRATSSVAWGSVRRMSDDVSLHRWTADDLAVLQRTNTPQMMSFLGGPETAEKLADRNERYRRGWETGDSAMFTVHLAGEQEAVGTIGYWPTSWHDRDVYETGWGITEPFQGRGIASRAVAEVLRTPLRTETARSSSLFRESTTRRRTHSAGPRLRESRRRRLRVSERTPDPRERVGVRPAGRALGVARDRVTIRSLGPSGLSGHPVSQAIRSLRPSGRSDRSRAQDCSHSSRSALIVSACVVGMPCGKPG